MADYIHGGTLRLGGRDNENGALIIVNASGEQIGKWDKDGIIATQGSFTGTVHATDGEFTGTVHATDGEFNGTVNATDGTFRGKVYATDGEFTGNVNAKGGNIGGWGIYASYISNGIPFNDRKQSKSTGMGTYGSNWAFWAGDGRFSVNQDGHVYAEDAYIEGEIQAARGMIGNWIISDGNLSNGIPFTGEENSSSAGMGTYGTDWAFWSGNGRFSVKNNGKLRATEAEISGTVNANNGTFNGIVNATSGVFESIIVRNSDIANSSLSGSAGTIDGGTYTNPYLSGGSMASVGGSYYGSCNGSVLNNCNLGGTSLATGNGEGYFNSGESGSARMYGSRTAQVDSGGNTYIGGAAIILQRGNVTVYTDLSVRGEKNRDIHTKHYGNRLMSACETPMPTFSDYGTGKIDDTGKCCIIIDPIFAETVDQFYIPVTFLTPYGQGELYIDEENSSHDVISVCGTPGLKFSWETRYRQINVVPERLRGAECGNPQIEELDYPESAMVAIEQNTTDYAMQGQEYFNFYESTAIDYAVEGCNYYTDFERSLIA